LNHVAFRVDTTDDVATDHPTRRPTTVGRRCRCDRHPIAGGAHVVYLEDRDGFEVELVAPGD